MSASVATPHTPQEVVYFVSIANFDHKHHEQNPFHHTCIFIMQGVKDSEGNITNVEAISAHGFDSHDMSGGRKGIERITPTGMKMVGSYALLQKEELDKMDLAGVTSSSLIQISLQEKKRLTKNIKDRITDQTNFFKSADEKARKLAKNKIIEDIKKDSQKELSVTEIEAELWKPEYRDKLEDYEKKFQLQCRDERYEEEIKKHVSLQQSAGKNNNEAGIANEAGVDAVITGTAIESKIISKENAAREAIKHQSGLAPFDIVFNPHVQDCKTLAINLVIDSLSSVSPEENDKNVTDNGRRRMELANLKKNFHLGGVPIGTKGMKEIIFNTRETSYQSYKEPYASPNRNWDRLSSNGGHCILQSSSLNQYVDLAGNSQSLKPVTKAENMILIAVNRNLVFLKRLMIDLDTDKFKNEINLIDNGLEALASKDTLSIRDTLQIYQTTLRSIDGKDQLHDLKKELKGVKLERGIAVELSKLPKIINHAKRQSPLASHHILGVREKIQHYLNKLTNLFRKADKYKFYESESEMKAAQQQRITKGPKK